MLGWWIVVSEGQPDGVMIDKANTLASWEAGLSGLRWLNDLVADGKARKLRSDGYPNRYEARAADVWPLLDEVTGRIDFSHKLFKLQIDRQRLAACPPDLVLTIDAWDQS
ncbi:MAG: hypothetical protein PHS77_12250 [Gallionellaceae bacterium]|jgi:hypothetical protein|nr:hypothetical protein [Gallionellaceae bacterium]